MENKIEQDKTNATDAEFLLSAIVSKANAMNELITIITECANVIKDNFEPTTQQAVRLAVGNIILTAKTIEIINDSDIKQADFSDFTNNN